MRDTDKLIDELSRGAEPVRPLAAPLARAGMLLAIVLGAIAAFAAFAGHTADTFTHLAHMPFTLELGGALLAGIGAIIAAVTLSIPGRARAWIYLPLPGLALWLIGGGLECHRQISDLGYAFTSAFASRDCFVFIVGAGVPLTATTYLFLRRHLAVDAARVTVLAALGSALLAATLLQFVHAHGTNPTDFLTHVVAVTLLALLGLVAARLDARH